MRKFSNSASTKKVHKMRIIKKVHKMRVLILVHKIRLFQKLAFCDPKFFMNVLDNVL